MISVRKISASDAENIRRALGLPEDCFNKDNDTFHLGGFLGEDNHVGVATFQRDDYDGAAAFRLIGMAVAPCGAGEGIDELMLAYGEDAIRNMGINICWCYAKADELGLYKKYDWECEKEDVSGFLMVKDLTKPHGCKKNI